MKFQSVLIWGVLFYFCFVPVPQAARFWTSSYCSDCSTINFLPGNYSQNCSYGEETGACVETKTYAYCVNLTAINVDLDCNCNGQSQRKKDPYDEHKYIDCSNQVNPIYMTCPDDYYFDPIQLDCVDCFNSSYTYTKINCTHYNISTNCGPYIGNCLPDKYFEETSEECVPKSIFECKESFTNGLYPDTMDCSIYHQCIDGKEPGFPQQCFNDTVFNGITLLCDSNLQAVSCTCDPVLPNYVDCFDAKEAYPTKNCKRYFQCVETSQGIYNPEVRNCPAGLFFNPQLKQCVSPIMAAMCENGLLDGILI